MRKIKLFCFPYGGGSASIYYKWRKNLMPDIELCPVELSGRGSRFDSPFYEELIDIVEDIYDTYSDDFDFYNYAFYGHSLGSLIAYELSHKINQMGKKLPLHAFFSGSRAPHHRRPDTIHHLPDCEFKEKIYEIGGTPKEIINEELFDIFLPILRADFKVYENYNYIEKENKLPFNITVINGRDENIPLNHITEWKLHTTGKIKFFRLKGDHFFINRRANEIINIINYTLSELIR
jgi:surfactin synthase thioesterase subunit